MKIEKVLGGGTCGVYSLVMANRTIADIVHTGDLGVYTARLTETEPGDDIGLWTISGPLGDSEMFFSVKKRMLLADKLKELAIVQARFQRRA